MLAVSGETLQDGEFASLAQDINLLVSLGVRIVLVHGIRPQIEGLLKRHGIARLFHRDRRVTDAATMDVVKQAAGATRCDIEALLSMGMPDSPMHGAHLRVAGGNFVTAQPLGCWTAWTCNTPARYAAQTAPPSAPASTMASWCCCRPSATR